MDEGWKTRMNNYELPASVSLPCRIFLGGGPEVRGLTRSLATRSAVLETSGDAVEPGATRWVPEVGEQVRVVLSLPISDEHGERVLEMRARVREVQPAGVDCFRLAISFRRPVFRKPEQVKGELALLAVVAPWKM